MGKTLNEMLINTSLHHWNRTVFNQDFGYYSGHKKAEVLSFDAVTILSQKSEICID